MTERKILLVSIWTAALFALLGIVWGVVADSGMIIFDGIYSLLSVGLSILSLLVLKQVQANHEDERFPFGKAHFEPLLIVFKSLMLIGMCTFSATNSFSELLAGGRNVSPGYALIYAFVSTIGCLLVTVLIQNKNKILASSLLQAERNQWLGDTLLSVGVLVGFSAAYALQDSELSWLVPYTDPGMVVLASSVFILLPLKSFIAAAREMIFYQMDEESMAPVKKEVVSIASELEAEYKLRMVSTGRELIIEVNFLVANGSFTVNEMDKIRHRVAAVAKKMKKHHWINASFTREPLWL